MGVFSESFRAEGDIGTPTAPRSDAERTSIISIAVYPLRGEGCQDGVATSIAISEGVMVQRRRR